MAGTMIPDGHHLHCWGLWAGLGGGFGEREARGTASTSASPSTLAASYLIKVMHAHCQNQSWFGFCLCRKISNMKNVLRKTGLL